MEAEATPTTTETPAAVAETKPAASVSKDAQADAIAELIGAPGPRRSKASEPAEEGKKDAPTGKSSKEPDHLAAANGRKPPAEPLDPLDFDPEALKTPEELKAVSERIIKARRQALELTRASHRAHAAAEKREEKLKSREQMIAEREKRAEALERYQTALAEDLEGGDGDKFLEAIAKLRKTSDPAGYWRNVMVSLAKGEKLKPTQQAQTDANPELKARLEAVEQMLAQQRQAAEAQGEAEFNRQVEAAKDRNLNFAKEHADTPRVQLYAADERTAHAVRERLADIMLSAKEHYGRYIDISEACGKLEEELSVHFELSQRADGKAQAGTNREKETASPGLEAGRATSKEPPKPETTRATIPASLGSAPTAAMRPRSANELRDWQLKQLDSSGFFD